MKLVFSFGADNEQVTMSPDSGSSFSWAVLVRWRVDPAKLVRSFVPFLSVLLPGLLVRDPLSFRLTVEGFSTLETCNIGLFLRFCCFFLVFFFFFFSFFFSGNL